MSTQADPPSRTSLAAASLLFLVSCLLLGWAIFPHLPQQVALALQARSLQKQQAEIRRLLSRDPKPGQTMPAITADLFGRPLPQAMRRRIVFVETVNQRNLSSVTAWLQKETSDNEAKWVVVSVGKQEDIQKLQRSSGAKFSVVWDADGKWHRQWNAVLLPRVYEVDAAWRLKAIIRPSGGCAEGCGGCGGGPT